MKLNGVNWKGPNELTLVLPRGDKEEDAIVIKARAILSYAEFIKLLPTPEPPIKMMRGGAKQPDFESPEYLQDVTAYGERKTQGMILQSLKATEGWVWEKVDMADPNTWSLYEQELSEFGFSQVEQQRIIGLVMDVNSLNQEKLDQARERFLSGMLDKLQNNGSHSQKAEVKITPSGERVSDKESVPQV
jgi:hypothetical protein